MNTMIYIILFLICIVFYIHIVYQLKLSNDENIYEVDYLNKKNLEEICDLRQPFALKIDNPVHLTKDELLSTGEKMNIIKWKEVVASDSEKQEEPKKVKKIYSEYNKLLLSNENIQKKYNYWKITSNLILHCSIVMI